MKRDRIVAAAGIAAALALTAVGVSAQEADGTWGSAKPGRVARPAASTVSPSQVYQNAGFASAGVALRNRGAGTIALSGVNGDIQAAWLYWAVITKGTPKKANTSVKLSSFFPAPGGATITVDGSVIGSGPSPCWLGDTTTVYRGAVDTSILSAGHGNGLFQITLNKGASGVTDNSDPFAVLKNGKPNSPLPEMEGASLVVVGSGSGTVAIYDEGFAGQMFIASSGFGYSLTLPLNPKRASTVLFAEIGADGQLFSGDLNPDPGIANKLTTINGVPVAGTGASDPLPDWDGLVGVPLPQLWDDSEHDVTTAAAGGSAAMAVQISGGAAASGGSDCLVTVANVVEMIGGGTQTTR